jgi:phenylacetic acid degradation operon negative regulatory protein
MRRVAGLRPFNARSLVLSILLGVDPPVLPVRSLVAVGELFGIAPGTMRTALSRMVAAGDLSVDNDGYRLVGRLLERKAAQDIGLRPAPGAWDGAWWVAVVTAPRRSIADRRAFRSHMANLRMGELRPDTWMRPANLDGPEGDGSLAVVRGELTSDDAAELAGRLWSLPSLATTAARLTARLADATPALADGHAAALPPTIALAAEVVRFLRAEPLLPAELTPDPWPPDELRRRYREFDRLVGRTLSMVLSFDSLPIGRDPKDRTAGTVSAG